MTLLTHSPYFTLGVKRGDKITTHSKLREMFGTLFCNVHALYTKSAMINLRPGIKRHGSYDSSVIL